MLHCRALSLVALVALSLGSPVPQKTTPSQKADNSKYRLPKDIVPQSYDIFLKPQYKGNRIYEIEEFKGTVKINAIVEKETDVIKLHYGTNIECDSLQILKIEDNEGSGSGIGSGDGSGSGIGSGDGSGSGIGSGDGSGSGIGSGDGSGSGSGGGNSGSGGGGGSDENGNNIESETTGYGAGNIHNNEIHQEDSLFSDETLEILTTNYDNDTEIFTITLKQKQTEGTKIRIEIDYTGKFVENSLAGFYYSSFNYNNDLRDEPAALLATQFESTSARAAFPCFDEPWMKAVFHLTIELADNINAIANTPGVVIDTSEIDETMIMRFKPTPKMSTYLLAFIVYEVPSFGKLSENGLFSAYARIESKGQELYSNDIGPIFLRELEKFTKVAYYSIDEEISEVAMEMDKMDEAAIPDFQAGAMENWGLVTYRENALLYDKDIHSSAAEKRVGEVIAHEFAHQWFGDFVTTEWWDSIWLNEGFADYMEYYLMDKHYEDWKLLDRFVLDEQMSAFDADSSANPNSLTNPVYTPTEISNHFGTITYSKGGSILRQIRNVLGVDAFQKAIQQYLKDRQFNYANPDHLFKWLIENNSDRTKLTKDELKTVLENWTKNPGYPVITVERDSDNKIKVKQDRYVFAEVTEIFNLKYCVYLTWYTDKSSSDLDKNPAPQDWVKKDENEKSIDLEESEDGWDWIIVNQNQAGYYRVDYSKALWTKLTQVLQNSATREKISALDRAALINNALNLARSAGNRNIDYAGAFKLMTFLRSDFEFEPWAAARSSLAHVEKLLINSQEYKDFIKYIVENAYKQVKFQEPTEEEEDDNVAITNRVNILTLACAAQYSGCLQEAQRRLEAALPPDNTEAEEVHPDLQTVVFCYGLKGANNGDLWDKLWEKYTSVRKDMTRRVIIASALGCVNDKAKLIQYLEYSVNESITVIPYHERYSVFSYVYANPEYGTEAALEFLETEGVFEKLNNNYGENRVRTVITGLGGRLTSTEHIDKLEKILQRNNLDEKYAGAITAANANVNWLETYGESVKRGMKGANGAPTVVLASTLAALCAAILTFIR